jgi:hypothetical protein
LCIPVELILLSSAAAQVRLMICISSSSLYTFPRVAFGSRLELVPIWYFGGPSL